MSRRTNLIGTQIGKYTVTAFLGSGTYGDVVLGEYNGRPYAIKRVSLRQPINTLTEISLYTMMAHPRIMEPYEYIVTDGGFVVNLVMHQSGQTLESKFLSSNLPRATEDEIRLIAQQILSAVEYMHYNSIIHRDLKPNNILMDSMEAHIIDFGLAAYLFQGMGKKSLYIQTPTHRAPEVFLGRDYLYAVDMWSVGMIILELFIGNIYFTGMDEQEIRETVTRRHDDIMQDIDTLNASDLAKDLIRQMLAYNPRRRITAGGALKHPWLSEFPYNRPDRIHMRKVDVDPNVYNLWYTSPLVRSILPRNVDPLIATYTYKLATYLTVRGYSISPSVLNILYHIAANIMLQDKAPSLTVSTFGGANLMYQILEDLDFNIFLI